MTRRSALALLVIALVAGVFILGFVRSCPVKLLSAQVVAITDRGRAVEFVLKNTSGRSVSCCFYRQQWFDGYWIPKTVTPYDRFDERCSVDPGGLVIVTLRVPDSGGRFCFHIRHGKTPPLHERLSELARKKLGLRPKGLRGRWEAIVTEPIQIPPA